QDGTYRYERFNLQSIMSNEQAADNRVLSNGDMVQVMTLATYADRSSFTVEGAVKNPNTFTFNPDGRLKLEDALLLAGGSTIDAASQGYIVRLDPKEPKTVTYLPIDIEKAMAAPGSADNLEIKSGDVIHIFNKGNSRDNLYVTISGAVRQPGQFAFGPGMKLGDLVNLAGGLAYGADAGRIDIARIELMSGENVKISHLSAQLNPEGEMQAPGSFALQAFDQVYVRNIPEFELQQNVMIEGEVRYPGTYSLMKDKERISDVIERAGGLTGEAFPEGAQLFRQGDSTGLVVIDLKEILSNNHTPSNIVLIKGDLIRIPKSKDLVTIEGFVNLDKAYSPKFLLGQRSISVAFRGVRSAKYYIDKFAAGVSSQGTPARIKVQYAD
ncbi:MAG TPA: SLBB domain-containing protein, partial [Saprospiraceae bacterium]|nr:SLBB domain-containing protein [Saprospiraceae bacterium]